jgi:trans-aconitate 2-methyltransferase
MRDPNQYAMFSDERSLPFFTLLSRVPDRPYKEVIDLGCGGGELTKAIADRFPKAHVVGLDNSPQMLAGASKHARPGLEFELGDIAKYDRPADLIFTNAALQWLTDHGTLFPQLADLVNPGGVFACQMPSNFTQPSHTLLEETARTGPWAEKLRPWQLQYVNPLEYYIEILMGLGFAVEAWETRYFFVLQGEDPVMQWVKGTSCQPILNLLDPQEQQAFCQTYAEALREFYPPAANGSTVFPFRRIFWVARRD